MDAPYLTKYLVHQRFCAQERPPMGTQLHRVYDHHEYMKYGTFQQTTFYIGRSGGSFEQPILQTESPESFGESPSPSANGNNSSRRKSSKLLFGTVHEVWEHQLGRRIPTTCDNLNPLPMMDPLLPDCSFEPGEPQLLAC